MIRRTVFRRTLLYEQTLRRRVGRRAGNAARMARSAASGTYLAAAHRSFPRCDGELAVRGVANRIDIIRDRYGVPHVFARSDEDALFGQGLVHAQDRLFQMDGMRRVAAGRLSEIAGPSALRGDRFLRRLGLRRIAERDVAELTPEQRAALEAYARGVNEGMRTLPALPPEFVLAGYEPEPWSPVDTMMIARLVLVSFAGNWDTELVRERLAAALGADQAAALDPVHHLAATETVTTRAYPPAAGRLLEAYRAALEAGLPLGVGSNAWAVSSERSATGAPLLASDPHVTSSMPGLFHVSHVQGDEADAVGAGVPGVPGIVIGHNRSIAWGITAGMANVADCYVEEFADDGSLRYRTPDGWAVAEEHVERIAIRGGSSVEERVLVTRHGPVIGPALPGETRAIALRSTAMEPGSVVAGFLGLWRATDVVTFERAADDWSGTTFNIVFAHVDGTIGYRFVGSVPRSNAGEGLLPRDGATSPGPAPIRAASELPRLLDPQTGVIVSANQAPGGDLELGEEWAEPQRAVRISQLLAERERHTVGSFQRIQVDRYSAHLVALRDLLLERGLVAQPEGPLLEAWDGVIAPRDPGAAVITAVFAELARTLAERAAGALAPLVLGAGLDGLTTYTSFHYRLQGAVIEATLEAAQPWYEDETDRDRQLLGAVTRAVEGLSVRFGPHPERWDHGAVHPLALDHPLRGIPAIGRWFSRGSLSFGGDVNTVWQAAYPIHAADAPTHVTAGYRQVIDLGDFDRSTFIVLPGSSGIPDHPRYDDCLDDYLAGRQRPLLFSRNAVEAAGEHWLIVEPETPGAAGGTA